MTFSLPLRTPAEARGREGEMRLAGTAVDTGTEVEVQGEAFDLIGQTCETDETAYLWDIQSDCMSWENNAVRVLGVRSVQMIASGAEYRFLVSSDHLQRRDHGILGAGGRSREFSPTTGLPYRVTYEFNAAGRGQSGALFVEDRGRLWTDPAGRPLRARGTVRVVEYLADDDGARLLSGEFDELTGQLNRVRLTEALVKTITGAVETRRPAAFLMVSINNLAAINQSFGFNVGDEVIAAAARTLKRRLRGGDSIGRYSSNKFGIVLQDCGAGAMRIAADRFLKAIRNTCVDTSVCQIAATISIGGVVVPDQATTVQDAVNQALQALDDAKSRRPDCLVVYEPRPGQITQRQRNIQIADEVTSALDQHRLRLLLQPIVDSETLAPTHYECLLRLDRPDGSVVSAGEFMPVAERLGMSHLIDQRTLELAVDLLKRYPKLRLALNVSGLTPSNQEWLAALHQLTGGRRDLTERLLLEITETALITDINQTILFVDTVKELGCKVAIDDFGAGYTSFKSLKLLDIDIVKIDGAFIRNLANDPEDLAFIKALRELARALKMQTVAEWVQDQATVDILREVGINLLQGYFCGEPVTPDKVAAQYR